MSSSMCTLPSRVSHLLQRLQTNTLNVCFTVLHGSHKGPLDCRGRDTRRAGAKARFLEDAVIYGVLHAVDGVGNGSKALLSKVARICQSDHLTLDLAHAVTERTGRPVDLGQE